MTTPATSQAQSLLEKAKEWFAKEASALSPFREKVDSRTSLLMETVEALHALDSRMQALEGVTTKDGPVVEAAVSDAEHAVAEGETPPASPA